MDEFIYQIRENFGNGHFLKLTLSKPVERKADLINIYARKVTIKNTQALSVTYRYKTNDQVKNFSLDDGLKAIEELVTTRFKNATLNTTSKVFTLIKGKKGNIKITESSVSQSSQTTNEHDKQKRKRANSDKAYLKHLGITNDQGEVIPKMADKYRQINKYLEIVEGLMESIDLSKEIKVVDMGSGKGYLTFALYDFLSTNLGFNTSITGIELREDLVGQCNRIAKLCGFDKLKFEKKTIQDYSEKELDILIALHACDTATDDAIAKGMYSNAKLIICAPCCHKQIRQSVKGKEQQNPLLKYGIFKERQFEMVTDTIRALIMEKHQYQSKIFEFVSNEHTRKNIMLVGVKSPHKRGRNTMEKIQNIKDEFQIEEHYLETLLKP